MNFSNQIGLSLIENTSNILTENDINILFSINDNSKNLIQTLFKNIFSQKKIILF